jgi:hypothetical protein
MGNVGHVVAVQPDGFRGLAEVGRVSSVFDEPVRVSRFPDPLPVAWVVGGSRPADSPDAAVLAFAEDGFDPGAEVVLGPGAPRVSPPDGFRGRCAVRDRRADAMVLDVEASAMGHVVVAEAYQRGWIATVDGSPAPVVPANLLFRAVPVPPGSHRVELRYRPPSVRLGAALTAAALAAAAALLRRGR